MKLLLTSGGFINRKIGEKFLEILDKPANEAKVLFIPTAAISDEAKYYVEECKRELMEHGIIEANLYIYDFEYEMSEDEALTYDVIYFPDGSTSHLLSRIRESGFNSIIESMIANDKTYVGVSAGSIIMTPNISLENPLDTLTVGLAYLQAFLSVHCNELDKGWYDEMQRKLPLQLIALNDNQAVLVDRDGYLIIQ